MARSTIAICAAWAARRCGSARASFIRRSQSNRVAAELTELVGHPLGLADHDHAQRLQEGLAGRLTHHALAQRRHPVRVRAEKGGFLDGK